MPAFSFREHYNAHELHRHRGARFNSRFRNISELNQIGAVRSLGIHHPHFVSNAPELSRGDCVNRCRLW